MREEGKELSWSVFPFISHRAQHTTGAPYVLGGDDGVYQSGLLLHSSPLRREGRRKEEVARRQRSVKTSRKTTLCGGWNSFVQVGGAETLFHEN